MAEILIDYNAECTDEIIEKVYSFDIVNNYET